MDLSKPLLLLLMICVLLLEIEAARPRRRQSAAGRRAGGRGRPSAPGRAGGRGRGRGHGRGRGRGKGRPRGRKPVITSAAPEPVPVYLELAGEEHPIPVFPLAPGSGHKPFTVRVASAHLDDSAASEETGSFSPPAALQSFSAADAGDSPGSSGALENAVLGEAGSPDSLSNAFGAGFFDSGTDFGGAPARFPNFQTAFDGTPSRRGGRRLFPPAEVSGVTAEVTAQPPADGSPQYTDSNATPASEPPAQYEYGYLVDGRRWSGGAAFGLQQSAADGLTRGRYEVQLPDGRTQVVTYTAGGQRGYEADVQYIGQASTGPQYGF